MTNGERLKRWRERKGWTIHHLAKEIGKQWGDVQRYEADETTPSLASAVRIESTTDGAVKCAGWVS